MSQSGPPPPTPQPPPPPSLPFAGRLDDGEMGERIRAFDWAATPLGPAAEWPQSLKTTVRLLLASRYPMFLWWGPELTNLYNDGYIPVLGARHPEALGHSAPRIWSEIWSVVGPQAEVVLREGRATWNESVLLVMERHGYTEETYFTFSYSPAPDDEGGVGGVFCACIEDTARVLGERRLRLLRRLGERSTAEAGTAEEVCRAAAAALAEDPHDIPFALVYLLADDGTARLHGATGLESGAAAAPREVVPGAEADPWGLAQVAATGEPQLAVDLEATFGRLPAGPWSDDWSRAALVLPLARAGTQEVPAGFLVAGLSPRLALDADYRSFLELAAGQLATALADRRAWEQERERAEALAELDRARTAFFSNVSHEFRTPLTLMLGPLEDVLAEGSLPPAESERLEMAHRNAQRLLELVNTLLDFSRLEAGRIEASYEPTDLAVFTAELASLFRSAAERAGLRLTVDCPPLGEPVWVDRSMWEKIVLNLLSNAFKFTFDGEIAVVLRRAGDGVELAVRDTGTGIPAAELPHLFERFHRVQGARARTFEGSGIGLSLVRELAALHGGEVAAASEVGAGSTFTVRLPLGNAHLPADRLGAGGAGGERPAAGPRGGAAVQEVLRWLPPQRGAPPEEPQAAPGPPAAAPGGAPARLLVADDNADMRDYLRRLLGQQYEVVTVPDGAAAASAVRASSFDLVLTDVMMPRLDGFGLLAALRGGEDTASLPVILLSARAGEEARVEGMEAGADDYLVKPFSARELLARVEAHLRLARQRRETTEALRESDRRKDEFLALLAHELRNPLAPIRNAAQVLKVLGGEDPKQRWAREVIERQTRHLTRLVDDLLDVSRITRGKIRLAREPVDLAEVVEAAVETNRPLVESRRHRLEVALPPGPLRAEGDFTRLVQVAGNLLNNAAKYTDEGGHLAVEVTREDGAAVLRVRDDGIGISDDLLSHVFDLFIQADRSLDRTHGGLGIGLTLVHRLVEMHGGSVAAASDGPGHGSTFTVRLPVLAEGAAAAAVPHSAADDASEAGAGALRVLVVEDNRDSAEALQLLLELGGHAVMAVHDGPAALAAAQDFAPQVVLCDIGLPGMDGYEVAERLRAQLAAAPPTLVALTGYGDRESRLRARAAGFDHHLVKPLSPKALDELLAAARSEARQPPPSA